MLYDTTGSFLLLFLFMYEGCKGSIERIECIEQNPS